MRTRIIVLTLVVAASGCATAKKIYGPDGREAFALNCSGTALSWNECYSKAGSLCQASGYDVLSQDGETGSIITAGPAGLLGGSTETRTMVVACKAAKPIK